MPCACRYLQYHQLSTSMLMFSLDRTSDAMQVNVWKRVFP